MPLDRAPASRLEQKDARIVPLTEPLLRLVAANERDPYTAEVITRDGAARLMTAPHLCYALIENGYALVAAGLVPLWHGRAEAWWLASTHARPRHLVLAARVGGLVLARRQRDPAFARIEVHVRDCAGWAASFARALGFEQEGLLRKWDPLGRDYRLFARIA